VIDVSLPELVARSDVIFSILPPSLALSLAEEIISALPHRSKDIPPLVYIDANATSPETVSRIADLFLPHGIPFLDGCVIGGPAREGYDPKIYLSCSSSYLGHIQEIADVLSGGGDGKGLKIEILEDAEHGAASALKMCYGGITKGTTGLASMLVLGWSSCALPGLLLFLRNIQVE
jgi:3-hydroxyisobutyrate dehydrogenase-like beta-hydroxyacid dehydrogenase